MKNAILLYSVLKINMRLVETVCYVLFKVIFLLLFLPMYDFSFKYV